MQESRELYPSSSDLIAHWKLLYAFKELRTMVTKPCLTPQEKEKHWQCYVTLAFRRYIIFVSGLKYLFDVVEVGDDVSEETVVEDEAVQDTMLNTNHLSNVQSNGLGTEGNDSKDKEFKTLMDELLPPLDVLMIWHSFMLTPKSYLGNMMSNQMEYLLNYPFPLQRIVDCVSESYVYSPADEQKENFMVVVNEAMEYLGLKEDFSYDSYKVSLEGIRLPIYCVCGHLLAMAPLTNQGKGFSDKSFKMENIDQCQCAMGPVLTMDILRKRKLLYDRNKFDVLPTCYKYYGPKYLGFKSSDSLFRDSNNSTRACLLRHPMGGQDLKSFICGSFMNKSLEQEDILVLRDYVELNPVSLTVPPTPATFQVHEDLVVAVLRHDRFVDLMTELLEPPFDTLLIPKAITRYEKFFKLMIELPGMIIPTLDIDLVWHTHLLNYRSYSEYSQSVAGQVIAHSDKIHEEVLDKLWTKSRELYRAKYGEPLSLCSCDYCTERSVSMFSRIFSRPVKDPFIDDHFYHVSYHNVTGTLQTQAYPWNSLKRTNDFVNDPFTNFDTEDHGNFYKSYSQYDLASNVYTTPFVIYNNNGLSTKGVFSKPYGFGGNGLGTWKH